MPLLFIDRVAVTKKRNIPGRIIEADKRPRLEELDFDDRDEEQGFDDRDEEQRFDHHQSNPIPEEEKLCDSGVHSDAEATELIYASYPHMHFCHG